MPRTIERISSSIHGHRLRTSSQQVIDVVQHARSRFTNGQKFATSQHLDMSRCRALALRCGKFVVQQAVELCELVRWWCPLVVLYNMSIAGVRVVEFGTNRRIAVMVTTA